MSILKLLISATVVASTLTALHGENAVPETCLVYRSGSSGRTDCDGFDRGQRRSIQRGGHGNKSQEIDQREVAKAPFTPSPLNGGWGEIRLRDGTVIKQKADSILSGESFGVAYFTGSRTWTSTAPVTEQNVATITPGLRRNVSLSRPGPLSARRSTRRVFARKAQPAGKR